MDKMLLTFLIEKRRAAIAKWLDDNAPYTRTDQFHLDSGTPEQAYWHLGYLCALDDLAAQITDGGATQDSEGNANL